MCHPVSKLIYVKQSQFQRVERTSSNNSPEKVEKNEKEAVVSCFSSSFWYTSHTVLYTLEETTYLIPLNRRGSWFFSTDQSCRLTSRNQLTDSELRRS